MDKINVAVFPCGSEVGLEINRSLRYSRHFNLIGLSSVSDHGRVLFNDYIGDLPLFREKNFIPQLKSTIQSRKIRFLIPAMDEVAAFLKDHESALNCEVVSAKKETIDVLTSKSKTYAKLKGIIPTPRVFTTYEDIQKRLPVFSKPDVGYGSRNTALIKSAEELDSRWPQHKNLVFCEYLPGQEYTIDCFSDTHHKILYSGSRIRNRIRMGISVNTKPIELPEVEYMAQKISETLELTGLWFFQLKENKNDDLVLLEVASRVSGSMALNRLKGVNFILLDLFQRLGLPIKIQASTLPDMELERAFNCQLITTLEFDTVYMDFDDCLYINEQLNTQIIRFLYQQLNAGHQLVLLSKHDGDLEKKLDDLRIGNLFDQVIHIHQSEHKYDHINSKKAIFVDDSYKEREEVRQHLGLPVFAPDVITALIDEKRM